MSRLIFESAGVNRKVLCGEYYCYRGELFRWTEAKPSDRSFPIWQLVKQKKILQPIQDQNVMLDLGGIIGRFMPHSLVLVSIGADDQGFHEPPQSVTVYGEKSLKKLQATLNSIYPLGE